MSSNKDTSVPEQQVQATSNGGNDGPAPDTTVRYFQRQLGPIIMDGSFNTSTEDLKVTLFASTRINNKLEGNLSRDIVQNYNNYMFEGSVKFYRKKGSGKEMWVVVDLDSVYSGHRHFDEQVVTW